MNIKKSMVTMLAGLTLASLPLTTASANGLPNKNANYWNQTRYVKVTKKISATERKVKNNSIQPKAVRKMNIKKGTVLAVSRIKINHGEWILQGLKSNKNAIWTTNQKNTSWMGKYTQPKAMQPKNAQSKLVTLTKRINITEKATNKNHKIQNKTLRKSSLKKGSIVYVKNFGGNEWLVYGHYMPKTSKNGAWVTNNKGTKWMKNYVPKKPQSKLVNLTKDINIVEKGVKNNTIQNNVISKNKLHAGMLVSVKPLSIYNDEWLVYGNNMPKGKDNGVWVTYTKGQKWMQEPQTIKSNYQTVNSSEIGNDYTDAYFQSDISSNGNTIIKDGQKIQAKKVDDNNALIKVDGNEYPMAINKNTLLPTRNNVTNFKDDSIVVSVYAPDDSNAVALSSYSPKNGYEWQQRLGNKQFRIFVYSTNSNGWINTGIVNSK